MRKAWWMGSLAALVLAGGVVPVYASYRNDLRVAEERISSGNRVIQTDCGPIEYADTGRGPVFLSIHGTGGGFDQGLLLTRQLGIGPERYRIIAPSRYGYLGTPMPAGDTSPPAEADAHACLLDALGIHEPIIVAGASAGALSATQFAIRYPDRVARLLLTIPASWAPPSGTEPPAGTVGNSSFIMNVVLRSDFIMWAFMKAAGGEMMSFIGVSKELQQHLSEEDRTNIAETMQGILPVSRRYRGILKDAANHAARTRYEVERIKAPTLVVDAMDMDTFPGAKYTAEHIPNARLVAFETGGHLLVGRGPASRAAVQEFLAQE